VANEGRPLSVGQWIRIEDLGFVCDSDTKRTVVAVATGTIGNTVGALILEYRA
jgi:hypothetical protein